MNGTACRWRTTSTAENVTQALLAQHPREPGTYDDLFREHYTKDANYYIHTDPWYRTRWILDLLGSLSIWIGAVLYNVSCFSEAYHVRPASSLLHLSFTMPSALVAQNGEFVAHARITSRSRDAREAMS